LPGLAAPVLLVASDTPYPEPLNATRRCRTRMGVGLVLARRTDRRARTLPHGCCRSPGGRADAVRDPRWKTCASAFPPRAPCRCWKRSPRRSHARGAAASPQLALASTWSSRHERPATLDHDGIAGLIPHAGRMCLLARVDAGTRDASAAPPPATSQRTIPCAARAACLASAAIEYAARQAAVHGALTGACRRPHGRARLPRQRPRRAPCTGCGWTTWRANWPSRRALAGHDASSCTPHRAPRRRHVADGRLAVVLDTPLPA
jgi:hypothetical protein